MLNANPRILFKISIIATSLSVCFHLFTFIWIDNVSKTLLKVLPLFIFPIIIFLFAYVILVINDLNKNSKSEGIWDFGMKNAPSWMKYICLIVCMYAWICRLYTFTNVAPSATDSKKQILCNDKIILRTITKEEYIKYKIDRGRGFSGMLIAFSLISMTVIYSKMIQEDKK